MRPFTFKTNRYRKKTNHGITKYGSISKGCNAPRKTKKKFITGHMISRAGVRKGKVSSPERINWAM